MAAFAEELLPKAEQRNKGDGRQPRKPLLYRTGARTWSCAVMKLIGVGDYGVELVGGHALRLDGAEGWHGGGVVLRLTPVVASVTSEFSEL